MKKIIKLSVAAALAATAMNAAVVDNVKMSGNAKLFFETGDEKAAVVQSTDSGKMFDQATNKGQALISISASANVGMVKANIRHQTLTTMGLENSIVDAPQTTTENTADTINYMDIANLSVTIGNTTLISGKQELSTPLCFTEKWNVAPNTFDANVLVNTSLIPNTTLIYADVKTSNADGANILDTKGAHINKAGKFDRKIDTNLVAASTTLAGAKVNAYYYDMNLDGHVKTFSATWIDASTKVAGVNLKAIYTELDKHTEIQTAGNNDDQTHAHALSASTKIAGLTTSVAYSKVSEGPLGFTNVATSKKTALPTQAVYVDGTSVAQPTAETIKVKVAGAEVAGVKLALQHVHCELNGDNLEETDLIATTKVAGINLKALLMNFSSKDGSTHLAANPSDDVQNATAFRVVANYSF